MLSGVAGYGPYASFFVWFLFWYGCGAHRRMGFHRAGGYPPVGGPFWAIANVIPLSNKAAAKPIRDDLVMIFSMPIPERRTSERH